MINQLDSKLGIRHYLNKKLKPIDTDEGLTYPVYIQLTFQGKSRYFRSRIMTEYLPDKDGVFDDSEIQDYINFDKDIIERCIFDSIGRTFAMKKILSLYDFYTQDIHYIITTYLRRLFTDYHDNFIEELADIHVNSLLMFYSDYDYTIKESPYTSHYLYNWIIDYKNEIRILEEIEGNTVCTRPVFNFVEALIGHVIKNKIVME